MSCLRLPGFRAGDHAKEMGLEALIGYHTRYRFGCLDVTVMPGGRQDVATSYPHGEARDALS